ncbi:hypothetical protein GGR56DRAFT_367907 [Xylariaceae sp. FL0804]|nr:hypothetical protein GGR56DRAFT_367907 [Xylariaceae sp. FL0804]
MEFREIQYDPAHDGAPNIYLSLEQPDKASSLLSPPHIHTAHLQGVECQWQIRACTSRGAARGRYPHSEVTFDSPDVCVLQDARQPMSPAQTGTADLENSTGTEVLANAIEIEETWDSARRMVEVALEKTMGIKKIFRGVKCSESIPALSLLELAPAIWNSRYLQSAAEHAKHIPVIARILAASTQGQSPNLRRKEAALMEDDLVEHQETSEATNGARPVEKSVQWKLWDVLQSTLTPKMGITRIPPEAVAGPGSQTPGAFSGFDENMVIQREDEDISLDTTYVDYNLPGTIYEETPADLTARPDLEWLNDDWEPDQYDNPMAIDRIESAEEGVQQLHPELWSELSDLLPSEAYEETPTLEDLSDIDHLAHKYTYDSGATDALNYQWTPESIDDAQTGDGYMVSPFEYPYRASMLLRDCDADLSLNLEPND